MEKPRNTLKRRLLTAAMTGFLAFSPIVEGTARAQQAPEVQQAAPVNYSVSTPTYPLMRDGVETRSYLVSMSRSMAPTITIDGPATITARFYPVFRNSEYPSGTLDVDITYSVDGAVNHEAHTTSRSTVTSPVLSSEDWSIGTPKNLTIEVGAGNHTVAFRSPDGFLDVVRVERPAPEPAPVEQPETRPAEPEPQPAQPEQGTEPRPEQPQEPEEHHYRPVFQLLGERTHLHELGSSGNHGDLNNVLITGDIPLSDELSIIAAGGFVSNALTLEQPEVSTSLRSLTGRLGVGLRFSSGDHSAYALVLGGYRALLNDVESQTDGRALDETIHSYDIGGQAGYSYSHWFELTVSGSNDPFNPISARIYGALPYGWVQDAYPWAELDLLWLHALQPIESPDMIGSANLAENVFNGRLTVGVPLFRLGPVVPSALVAGDMNASEGSVHGDFMLGGSLGLDFLEQRLRIEAAGAASPLTATPFFLLRVGYSQ